MNIKKQNKKLKKEKEIQVIWFILTLDMFISKEDDKENHKELYQQFKADVFSYGINKDIRDKTLDRLSSAQTDIILSKHR